jgi:hypothetical protein
MVEAKLSPELPDRDLGDKDVALIIDMRRDNEIFLANQVTELQKWYDTWVLKPDP